MSHLIIALLTRSPFCCAASKVRLPGREEQSIRKEPSGRQEAKLLKDIHALELGSCNSPHIEGDLIRAHTASTALPENVQTAAEDSESDLSMSPADGGYNFQEENSSKWATRSFKQDKETLVEQLNRTSPNKVTGFINPIYSNQDGKGLEQNPIFEM